MNFSRRAGARRLDPASLRLPIVALVDVVMFLLVYFMVAGNLSSQESELATALRTERGRAGRAADLQPQILLVETAEGHTRFRLGDRVVADRPSLVALLRELPTEGGVIVKATPESPVAGVAAAIQASKDAGFSKVSYLAGS